ncbi:hypothetical protein BGZ46_010483 [Entomortierella lignicola]|nr:hypothetical protein BGZ46_010483 [Entomortierella lignicola]
MLACSLGLACLGIVLELIFHRTPLWMNRKVLFSICGQPFGKRPDQLEDQKLGHSTGSSRWNPFLAIYLCGKGKVAVEAPCRDGDGSQVNQNNEPIAVSANRFSTHEANPEANRSSVMTLGLPEEHYVLGLENFSDIETIAASNSGTLSKSSSNHVEERQGEQPVDVLLPMPAEVTIENIDLSEDTNNKDFTGPQFEAVTYQVAPERPS